MVGLLSAEDYAGYADEGRRLAVDLPEVTPMDAARFIAEMTPIVGDAMAAKELWEEATSENPNWGLVGLLGGATVVGLIPGIGPAAAKAVKSGARGLLDTAKRVEVDPNTMGSLLGNVRLKPKVSIQDTIQSKYPDVSVDLFGDSEKGYELSKIVVPKGSRKQGTGTKVMKDILSLADAQGARVSLTPDSAFGGSKPRLKKFYKKFGFVDNKGSNKDFTTRNTMYRDPVTPTSSPAQEVSGLLAPAPPKIRAYQGTPHKFSAERLVRMPDGSTQYIVGSPDVLPDIPAGAEVLEDFPLGRMRMDKIGTGEGAQAYGYGLYSAEAEDVARVYKEQLSGGASSAGQKKLDRYKGDIDAALNDTLSNLKRLDERELSGDFVGDEKTLEVLRVMHTKVLKQLDDYKTNGVFPSGSMYKIDINANPNDFLDYDAPLSNQTGRAAEYISNYEMLTGQPILPLPTSQKTNTGKDLMLKIGGEKLRAGAENPSAEISDYLRAEGIPGIKYKDAGSRGTADATRNFVVFDEKLINIVKRYGVAGAAAMLGVTAMDVEQAMAQGMQQPSGLLTPDMINSQQADQRPYNAGLLQ